MDKEKILKAIMKLPKENTYNPINTMNGINIDDLMSVIDKFDKTPTYQDLLNKNVGLEQQLKKKDEVIDKAINLIKLYGKYNVEKCTRGFNMMTADLNKLLQILEDKEVE